MTINKEEEQYLELVRDCIENGDYRMERTGTGAYSVFGRQMRFSLENNVLPLITTKSVPFRIVLEELLFFINGLTDNKILQEKKIHIWDGNSSKEFFEKNNINRREGDLGPIYGFQWRHWNAEYKTCDDDYSNKGIDQLNNVIELIKKNKADRRLVVSAWNPSQLSIMALPPCHCFFQFFVFKNKLSCQLYQRSADIGLGVPFNIASYSLLTIIVAKLTGLEPGEFIHTFGDVHVYSNHVEQLKTQLVRETRSFPTIRLNDKEYKKLEDFKFEDFILDNYDPHPKIIMKMGI